MKIIKNEKLINRNAKFGLYASLLGLVAMGVSLYFVSPTFKGTTSVTQTSILFVAVVVSLILTQVSFYFGNRFGRRPRPDELLDNALKGTPGEYSIYHHSAVVPHLLVGPSGLWVLLPIRQKGKAAFVNDRWKASGGGVIQAYMRIFAQESLGRPELEAQHQMNRLTKFLQEKLGDAPLPGINAALVFLDPALEIQAEGSPVPAMHLKKLKEFIRKSPKERALNAGDIEKLRAVIEQST